VRPFHVHERIERAETLPAEVYRDPAWFARARERVFARSWQLLLEPPPGPEEARPLTLLPDCLDEPLLLARDAGGALRCLSNVCTHRGAVLLDAPCPSCALRCRYHGRRFGLDGRCLSMPEFAQVEGFPGPRDHLPELPLPALGPLLWTGLAPEPAFEALVGPLRERLAFLDWAGLRPDPASSRVYEVDASWALYVDNYLEGFHIPYVHPALNAALDWEAYRTELHPWGVLQVGVANPGEPVFPLPAGHPDAGQRVGAYYWWLFPNALLNFYPWGLSVNLVLPRGPERCRVAYAAWVLDPALRERGAGAGLHQVELEDEAVVASVMRGVRSRLYERGRYSPTREQGVHHFHRLLAAALDAGAPA
jgi:choline monooxygenase